MIPIKLSLRNFMCYRDNLSSLSFDEIHVACLCGDNGSGKSAIFDAVTWALWGESRAKSDDDLIHLGQSEMEVELEFLARGQRYRVLRKRTKPSPTRAGHTILELQIASDGDFKPISGNSKAETQRKMIELLRLDYITFINSAFLRQGHADEFSIKTPGERKEILANILDLSRYDEFEKRAKALAADRRARADRLESTIAEIDLQLVHRGDYEGEIEKVRHEIGRLEKQKRTEEAIISTLRGQREALALKKEQLLNTEVRISQTKQELERLRRKSREHQTRIAEYEHVLKEKMAIQEGYSKYIEIEGLNNGFNQKLSRLLDLVERINSLEKAIKEAATELTVEHGIVQARITEREATFSRMTQLEEALAEAQGRLAELSKLEEAVAEERTQAQQIASRISYLESNSARLEEESVDLKEKLRLLARGDVRCPLCETELGIEELQRIEAKLVVEAEDKVESRQNYNEEIDKRKSELRSLNDELAQRESLVNRERASRQSHLDIVKKEMTEARQAEVELVQERSRSKAIEQRLSIKDYAIGEQQALSELKKEEVELGYDKGRHEYLQEQLTGLHKYKSLKQELDEAERAVDNEKNALTESEGIISSRSSAVEVDLKTHDDLSKEIIALPDIASKLTMAEQTYKTLLEDERRVRDSLATMQERLRYLTELDVSKQEKEKLLHQLLQEEGIYKELAEAFSKRGIQALLIERSLPEIETEANRLLGKMTDNRMSLRLESQREMKTKKGDIAETLDIKIADELGTRNYEMYSGGEAFRIDLALRIALSRLLVRRAGASLPVLIIDEGFGTQDSMGRERLVEAINSIQDDFEKIIVITHLEELKDKFPVLINVSRIDGGSIISVS